MNCEHCQDTKRVRDWRTYMKAWRDRLAVGDQLWMLQVSWHELLQTCRDLRDFNRSPMWKSRRGGYEVDCACWY